MREEKESSRSSTRDRCRNRNLLPWCWINGLEWNIGTCFLLALILGFLAFPFSFLDELESRRKFGLWVLCVEGIWQFGLALFLCWKDFFCLLLFSIKIKIVNLIFGEELWWRLKNMTNFLEDSGCNRLIAGSGKLEKTRFGITLLVQEVWRA